MSVAEHRAKTEGERSIVAPNSPTPLTLQFAGDSTIDLVGLLKCLNPDSKNLT